MTSRWVPPLALVAAVVLAAPGLWLHLSWVGNQDWDYFAHQYEAMRRTIVEFHQFPWWNPWSSGGMPAAANPQLGVLSVNLPAVMAFGPYPGMKLALLLHLVVAAEGARRLAARWMRDPLAQMLVGFVYVTNGAVLMYTTAGHLGIELATSVPWALLFAFALEDDWRAGFGLGVVLALAALTGLQYILVNLALILVSVLAWRLVVNGPGRARAVGGSLVAGVTVLAFAGMALALGFEIISDFPRGRGDVIAQRIAPSVWAKAFFLPGQTLAYRPEEWGNALHLGWHEFGCYLGLPVAVLLAASFAHGWRWWHTIVAGCFWCALGNTRWYEPSTWVAGLPVLGMLRVATRWRVVGVFGIALACGAAIDDWRRSPSGARRALAALFVVAVAADLGTNAVLAYRDVFRPPGPPFVRKAPGTDFVQGEMLPFTPDGPCMLDAVRANEGVVYGYEPLLAHDQDLTSARRWWGHEDYRGEYWSDGGPVTLLYWSPNAITLAAPPGAWVEVNQNPGAYWLLGGRRAFPDLRAFDRHQHLRVRAGTSGRIELSVLPPAFGIGVWLNAIGLAGVLVAGGLAWRRGR